MSDSTPTRRRSSLNRRSVLKAMGAGAVAGTALTGTASANHIDIWVWRTTNASSTAQSYAVNALEDAISQLGKSGDLDVHNEGSLSGNWPNDGNGTYNEYKQEFDNQRPWTYSGDLHYLIYREGLVDGFSFDDDAAAGKAWGSLKSSNTPVSIANADMHNYDLTTYKNFVKHEFLHTVVDGNYAPDSGNEHSFGAQKGWVCENTPLLTGYAESKRGGNEKPDSCCNKDTVDTCDAHVGTLSDCTINEATYWLDYVY